MGEEGAKGQGVRHGSLFSGIGGFDLAAEWMGWENLFHCEWNQFGQKVLKYYWPNAISYDDICKTDFTIWNGRIDILTGGFPCQPYSMAGKRQGTEDARHLWPEMLRAIRECQPTWIVGENVPGLINWSGGLVFEQVCADLEGEGYEVQPIVLPASGVNAPHRRDRVWFVAYYRNSKQQGLEGSDRSQESKGFESGRSERTTQNPNENGRGGDERKEESSIGRFGDIGAGDNERVRTDHAEIGVITDTEGERINRINGDDNGQTGENGKRDDELDSNSESYATNANGIGLRGQSDRIGKSGLTHETSKRTDWTDWPTVAPIRDVNDGVSRIMVRNIKPEIYATIKDRYTDKDLQEVWDCFQSEDIREQIGGLYKIHDPSLLLQTVQLCSTSYKYEGGFSDFSEETSKDLLLKLSDHKTFANTPRGRELEKQFSEQFKDTLPKLSHEIALVTMEAERASKKFASWHRNESIKAGGNAIVPQVALQIFKTIQQINNHK